MVQTKEKFWTDENGVQIPANRINMAEKTREKKTAALLKKAQDLNARLKAFKEELKDSCDEMEEVSFGVLGVNKENFKGNLTFFNFDRSVKIERSISEPMKFDDLTIAGAKQKLDEFLREAIESKFDFAKEMIITAFETTNGKLDPKRITAIARYEAKVNHPLFSDACRLIQQAIRRPGSKTYYRIWVKEEGDKYEAIELNLSNIS